jgi:hypothetical protein
LWSTLRPPSTGFRPPGRSRGEPRAGSAMAQQVAGLAWSTLGVSMPIRASLSNGPRPLHDCPINSAMKSLSTGAHFSPSNPLAE